MCKVASEESVNPTIHQVKLGKSKIVQVRVHLMSRPSQIKEIEPNGFQGLDSLEELNLNRNNMIKIESNSFQHFKKLKIFNLYQNQIKNLTLSTKTQVDQN
jgi:Leucine-rich repeat (LRR) protein